MKRDIYQEITDYMISALETVDRNDYKAPFAQLTALAPPMNPTSTQYYNGINTVVLWCKQHEHKYSSNEWATFQQWKNKGAMVKKGEKASSIIFYKQVKKKEENPQGEPEFYNMVKFYSVFNADQVENYEPSTGKENLVLGTASKIEEIEKFVTQTKAEIKTGNIPCFKPLMDCIEMPEDDVFIGNAQSATENKYAVLFHELTHWTGGENRLERVQNDRINHPEDYAYEELIAELGSAFLCAQFGIKQQRRDDHAIYIKSWLAALKNDKKFIFKASAQAQKAVDLLNELAA